jgi:RNA polymerase sigma factor (TIGR02999 family)
MDQTVGSSFSEHYVQLRTLARAHLARERMRVSTGTLAHDAYLEMQGSPHLRFASREQFLGYASRVMRHLLVDMARQRQALKRGGDALAMTLSQAVDLPETCFGQPDRMLALDQAFERLGRTRPELLKVAEMRALFDLSFTEMAETLGRHEAQVRRDWQRAKAFILDLMEPRDEP